MASTKHEPILAATVRLTSAAEALAALAAYVRVETEGLSVDPRIRELLRAVTEEITGNAESDPTGPNQQVVGMARSLLHESAALVDDPTRQGGWATVDETVLQGMGRLSMAITGALAVAEQVLPGLADTLRQSEACILDVGTGTGWLSVAMARAYPNPTITGIDVYPTALDLARRNVETEGLGTRISLRLQDVVTLDEGEFDLIWLPLPFIPQQIVPAAISAAARALRPGGWLIPGLFAGPDDRLSQLLLDLRTVRSGGHPWTTPELVHFLGTAGLENIGEVQRTWVAPVRLFAGRKVR